MNDKLERGDYFFRSLQLREGFFKSDVTMADSKEDEKTPDLSESLIILVMVGSTVSKHSRRSDVCMGSISHDLGAQLVTTECK